MGALGGASKMKTATEYRAMADECFQWAGETHDRAVRAGYLGLAQVWLDAAAKLDGLPAKRIAPEGKAHPDTPASDPQKDVA
jgi:hypothetical protein